MAPTNRSQEGEIQPDLLTQVMIDSEIIEERSGETKNRESVLASHSEHAPRENSLLKSNKQKKLRGLKTPRACKKACLKQAIAPLDYNSECSCLSQAKFDKLKLNHKRSKDRLYLQFNKKIKEQQLQIFERDAKIELLKEMLFKFMKQ